jgi:hypothetical protein
MPKKIFFFFVFLATVYLRNISSAHQLSGKITAEEMATATSEIPEQLSYKIASLLEFKNDTDNNNLVETNLALSLEQGHATHIP